MDAGRHPNITLLTNSEVSSVSGYVGNYKVTVKRKPRYIKEEPASAAFSASTLDLQRGEVPRRVPDGPGQAQAHLSALRPGHAAGGAHPPDRCIQSKTGKCKKTCAAACDRKAIDFEQKEETVQVDVGAIIISTGFETFDASGSPSTAMASIPMSTQASKWSVSPRPPVRRTERWSCATGPIRRASASSTASAPGTRGRTGGAPGSAACTPSSSPTW